MKFLSKINDKKDLVTKEYLEIFLKNKETGNLQKDFSEDIKKIETELKTLQNKIINLENTKGETAGGTTSGTFEGDGITKKDFDDLKLKVSNLNSQVNSISRKQRDVEALQSEIMWNKNRIGMLELKVNSLEKK